MPRTLVTSPVAQDRLDAARRWLQERASGEVTLIVGATHGAADALVRTVVAERGGAFGWHRLSLGALAHELALEPLAARGLVSVGSLAHEALVARTLHARAPTGDLGRLGAVADKPRLPRAVAATLADLRLARLPPGSLAERDPTLGGLDDATEAALREAHLADRATVLRLATEVAAAPDARHALLAVPLLLLDVALVTAAERALVAALVARSPTVLATLPAGDERTRRALESALGADAVAAEMTESAAVAPSLRRLALHLFARDAPRAEASASVTILSAPGERRECTEIARQVLREAEAGVPFDRMAVLLRRPMQYRDHLDHAFRRAGLPAYFTRGTVRPDPAGRALLALLACAAEGLSARRFAEYLSLAEVPDASPEGAPPARALEWVPADDELAAMLVTPAGDDAIDPSGLDAPAAETGTLPADPELPPVVAGSLRAPRRWEQLLVEAAVIGGRDRWIRRLDGLRHSIERGLVTRDDPAGPELDRARRRLAELAALRGYALPLLERLETLREPASWGEWIARLEELAARAVRHPDRILACLGELRPMAPVGPVDLNEVRLVLTPRLSELVVRPRPEPSGHVLVLPIDATRGRAFDVVFVPGLAERLFPPKLSEDPILPDRVRESLSAELAVAADRVAAERLALRLAVGAARRRVVLSYPRLDLEQGRPRVPSFYGLEVVRAAEGELPGFDALARRAALVARTRIGWPAPEQPIDALDEAEHDLALLDGFFRQPGEETLGAARYLLDTNAHLARALRARGRRWLRRWGPNDGLRSPGATARSALLEHGFEHRSYSPTALERYARCPYSFFLNAILRLAPRETPEAIEEMDPLVRGSLTHEIQFATLVELRSRGWLPLSAERLEPAQELLERVLDQVSARYRDDLAPAIERVWHDGVAGIRADLREWLRRGTGDPRWVPAHFELSFGLRAGDREVRDAHSRDASVPLAAGVQLRGSIDLVERTSDGTTLRATDHKTGKARVPAGSIVGGGESLQPVLYALALEALFPDQRVESGRLYYCTVRGDYQERVIPLDAEARAAAGEVITTIRGALDAGFLPAAPARDACRWCDFARVCGPNEELRVARKPAGELAALVRLRGMR